MLENMGILAAFGAMLCWGIGDFLIQRSTRRIGNIETIFFIGLLGSLGLLPFVYSELPSVLSNSNLMLTLFFLGFFTLLSSATHYKALKIGKLCVVEPILELELPLTIMFSMLLLSEVLTPLQAILSAAIFAGIMILSLSKRKRMNCSVFEKGALLAIAAAAVYGFLNFFTGVVARTTSPMLAIWSAWTVCAIICFAYLMKKRGLAALVNDAKKYKGMIITVSFFDTLSWVFFATAMVSIPISIATAISESYPAIAALLGIMVNREMLKNRQFLGMGIALASSIALALVI